MTLLVAAGSSCNAAPPVALPMVDIASEAITLARDINGISDVVQLSDGTIVFGEVFEDRLVLIAPGTHIPRHIGREGSGPGEFQRIDGLLKVHDDTVAVMDPMLRRLSLFDRTGHFVRAIPLLAGPEGAVWLDCTFYSDGSGHVYAVPTKDRSRKRSSFPLDTLPVLRIPTDGSSPTRIWAFEVNAPRWFPMTNGHVRSRLPFIAPVVVGVSENGDFRATTSDGKRLMSRSVDGLVTTGPTFAFPERSVTRAERDSFTEWFTSRATYAGTRFEFPSKRAAFDHGKISPRGETWLRATESIPNRSTYLLVDSLGRVRLTVLVAAGSRVAGFGAEVVFLTTPSAEGAWDLHTIPYPRSSTAPAGSVLRHPDRGGDAARPAPPALRFFETIP